MRALLVLAVSLVGALGCFTPTKANADETAEETASVNTLVAAIKGLEPWRQSKGYSKEGWDAAISVARLIQGTDAAIVEKVLDAYMAQVRNAPANGDFEPDSRPFILMRVVFDLPEKAEPREAFSFKGWTNSKERERDGRVNLAWPVSWGPAGPSLVARYEGSEGLPYSAADEFRLMKRKFAFRKLEKR